MPGVTGFTLPAKVVCVGGARPNFMKLAPLLRKLSEDPAFEVILVHTGQHYDDRMSGQFFRELGLPTPAYNLQAGSGSHSRQTAEVMRGFETVIVAEHPAATVVVGDVNSTMAAALVSAKLAIPVVHVEAGLRSFDRRMPEEINRVVTDAISDLLLVTEASGMRNLAAEGIPAHRMHLVGNLMIDTLFANLARAREKSTILRDLGLENESFGLVTLHRPSNVDNPERLQEILGALDSISETLPLLFPVHPRTRDHVEGGNSPHLRLIHPLGYIDFLALMCRSGVVLTDSGGIQEETTALGVPCLTLRENTERPITVEQGTNRLAGVTRDSILAAWAEHRRHPKRGRIPPLWDGQASERSRLALREFLTIR